MPLYVSLAPVAGDGPPEIRRVIPGRREHQRCEASPNWAPITDEQLAQLEAGEPVAGVVGKPKGK